MDSKTKKALLKMGYLVPISMLVVGILAIIFLQRILFGYDMAYGIVAAIAVSIVILLLIYLTRLQLKKLEENKKLKRVIPAIYSFISIISIVCIVLAAMFVTPYASAVRYNTGPVLTWGSDQDPQTEVTIMWRTKENSNSIVYYGTSADSLNQEVNLDESLKWHQVPLSGMDPGQKYYYRLGNFRESEIFSFTTAPAGEEDYSFLVFADPRQNSGLLGTTFQPNVPKEMDAYVKEKEMDLAFSICCGDIVSEGTDEAIWKSWFDDISTSSDLSSLAPLQIAVGNHERHDNCEGDIFDRRYPYESKPHYYYSYNYSNTHFLMADPWNYTSSACWWGEFTEEQLTWIENDLQKASSKKYKIVSLHPPIVSDGEVKEAYQDFISLMEQYDVDAVFYGHAHRFEVNEINGVNYFMVGVGGNNGQNAQPPGFCQVDVSAHNITLSMNWLNGTNQALTVIE